MDGLCGRLPRRGRHLSLESREQLGSHLSVLSELLAGLTVCHETLDSLAVRTAVEMAGICSIHAPMCPNNLEATTCCVVDVSYIVKPASVNCLVC